MPQAVFSLLIFSTFMNNVLDVVKCCIHCFADDVKIYCEINPNTGADVLG